MPRKRIDLRKARITPSLATQRAYQAEGRCARCGKDRDRPGALCKACSDEHNRITREAKQALFSGGRCTSCKREHDAGTWICSACAEKQRASRKRSEARKQAREAEKLTMLGAAEAGLATTRNRKAGLRKMTR